MGWIVREIPPDGILEEAVRRGDAVSETLRRITNRLREESIDYAIVGGIAMAVHGYWRFTNDVDVLVTSQGLRRVRERLLGRGYSSGDSPLTIRDLQTGIDVEFITTGEFPGDGKPKPVVFPVPRDASIDRDGRRVIALPKLIELKLASGLSAEHRRLRDLADVQDLIIALKLPRELGEQIDPSVRDEFYRMWDAAQKL